MKGDFYIKGRQNFKSKGERQIARFLEKENILYNYESPLAVVDDGKTKIWYPDFQLPEYGLIMEYFGVTGSAEYDRQTKHKMDVYKSSGIEGIFLTEDSLKGDWPAYIAGQIGSILKGRLDRFYSRNNKVWPFDE
ncbi:MAG: hypothetical protein A2Y10_06005 [Planctomycetes bacterium GWF2_41_51]|nr:MAG: hypothetical protein A2Y10_06005 [Planctomycetes bacterium GWF2_41_51]